MKLCIKDLPYRLAFDIIKFCLENNIDTENCLKMINASSETETKIDWSIDVPDEYVTWLTIKFGL